MAEKSEKYENNSNMTKNNDIPVDLMYHEKQWLGHCAVHTLNNLFQTNWMTFEKMNKIARKLYHEDQNTGLLGTYSFNPYTSTVPYLGYFDIGCIIRALKEKDCEIIEHILQIADLHKLCCARESVIGLIINEANSSLLGLWNSRHWYSILVTHQHSHEDNKRNCTFINLDSKLSSPQIFANEKHLKEFLAHEIQFNQSQIFVVSQIISTTPTQSQHQPQREEQSVVDH